MSSSLCLCTRLLFKTGTAFQPAIRLQRLCSGALTQDRAENSLLGACMYKSERWSWRRGRLVAWFLLEPGSRSSARVPSLSLEKFWLGKVVAQYGVSAARTVEAMWMFPADIIAVFHIGRGQE